MSEIPAYIFKILDKELYDIQCDLLKKVATTYNLCEKEVIEKFLTDPLKVLPPTDKQVVITQKHNAPPPVPDDRRCMARVWNRGKGGRCSRSMCADSDLCGHHCKLLEKNGFLQHGKMNEPPPKSAFATPSKKQALYK